MADLLVDTDVFVDHLRVASGIGGPDDRLAFSSVTRAELFAGQRVDEAGLRLLLGALRELPVEAGVAERGGRVRRTTALALPDALIAATALEHDLTLLTRNRRHFERVGGLRLRSPA